MPVIPTATTATLTFLFTDIEGSTQRWENQREAMSVALVRHDQVVRDAIEAHDGEVFKTVGDAFCAAFGSARAALEAALAVQRALSDVDESTFAAALGDLRVRVAVHSGEVERRGGDYFGRPVNRVARLLSVGHGGQVLLSEATFDLVRDDLPEEVTLRDLGEHRLKDLARAERVYRVVVVDLRADFPVLRSLDLHPHNLPVQLTSFVGREREVEAVKAALDRSRLVTVTGIGGGGKTRVALHVAAEVIDEFPDGVWFADLSAVADSRLVAQTVATVLGLREEPRRTIEETLLAYVREKRMLLLLDNCEQVVEACAGLVVRLLTGAERMVVLATSREALQVPGEAVWTVPHPPE